MRKCRNKLRLVILLYLLSILIFIRGYIMVYQANPKMFWAFVVLGIAGIVSGIAKAFLED